MSTTLWEVLERKGTPQQNANVKYLTNYASELLDVIRDTFPTYTLHNRVHAKNVIALMENLLGHRAGDLTALEAAMLILAAYFHDSGMAFTDDERNSLPHTSEFQTYLRNNPSEYLRFRENQDTPDNHTLEGFCRWIHADRVRTILAGLPEDRLRWGNIPIAHHLGELCRSHNLPTTSLKAEIFDGDFINQCDLRLCGIILRLADILDFDNSRSPEAVYHYMGIQRGNTPRLQRSEVEWRKHLKSDGFIFPPIKTADYSLGFIAGPDHPAVQHDILEFLVVIEAEMAACKQLISYCTERWRNLPLPGSIARSGIISDGFTYGDFRFKLDKDAILDLFMGENLYSNPDVFIRELLQNSIDAVRARCRLEGTDTESSGYRIDVSEWMDNEGYQWIRIDDDGCGMNLEIIDKFLLRVGASYYSTSGFKADLLRVETGMQSPPMISIGKFGVGLLSVFLVADRIELSTRRVVHGGNTDEAVRLSFPQKTDFLVVQTETKQSTASTMPSSSGSVENGYRRPDQPGTSIALRIDPTRMDERVDVRRLCRHYLLKSPVQISLDGEDVELLSALNDDDAISVPLNWSRELKELDPELVNALQQVKLHVKKLDISAVRARGEIDGCGYFVFVDASALKSALSTIDANKLPGVAGLNFSYVNPYTDDDDDYDERIDINDPESPLRLGPFVKLAYYGQERVHVTLNFYDRSAYHYVQRFDPYDDEVLSQFALVGEINSDDPFRLSATIPFSKIGLELPFIKSSVGYEENEEDVDEDDVDEDDYPDRVHPDFIFDNPMYWDDRWLNERESFISTWSHNGIRLPIDFLKSNEEWLSTETKSNDHYISGNVLASLWLLDALRPDLNVARDHVRSLPYAVVSALQLTLRRALQGAGEKEAADNFLKNLSVINNLKRMSGDVTLGEIYADPLTTSPKGWKTEKLFLVDGYHDRLSARDLSNCISEQSPRLVTILPTGHFIDCLSVALLQLNFDFVSVGLGRYEILRCLSEDGVDNRLLRYLPGSFANYKEGPDILRRSNQGNYQETWDVANLAHPLVDWYISISPTLSTLSMATDRDISRFLLLHNPRLRDRFRKFKASIRSANKMLRSHGPTYSGSLNVEMLGGVV
jgi:hypothetical protein